MNYLLFVICDFDIIYKYVYSVRGFFKAAHLDVDKMSFTSVLCNQTQVNLTFSHVEPFNISQSTGNATSAVSTAQSNWTSTSSLTLFVIITGSLTNIGLLFIFYKRTSMRTPFGMYLINLISANIIIAVMWEPLLLAQQLYPSWTLGYSACLFRQYLAWTINAVVNWSHFLIALNRFWAVVFPVSYRHHHSIKLAIGTCLLVWLIINISIIPTVVVITELTKPDAKGKQRCAINTDLIGQWGTISQVVLYNLPVALVVLLYPVIFSKSFTGNRQRRRRVANDTSQRVSRHGTNAVNTSGAQRVKPTPTDGNPEARKREVRGCCRKPQYGSTTGFVTLTLTTLTAIVCLAPSEVYFFLLIVFDIEPPVSFYSVVKILQSLTAIFDPILIVLANPELRKLVKDRIVSCFS